MAGVFKTFFVSGFFLALLVGMPVSLSAAVVSSPIPLDSWIYPALDKLSGLGLIDSVLQGSRPYTRMEAARQVDEAISATKHVSTLPVVSELLHHLCDELAVSLAELRGDMDSSGYLKPVRQLDFDYIYRSGDDSFIVGDGVDAQQFSLAYNTAGVDYVDGSSVQLRLLGDARISDLIQFDWELLLSSTSPDDFDLRWQQVRAAVALGAFELSFGRQSLWWGPGRHGTLVLTNNSKPLDMIRLTNPSPILLPWFLKYLGPFRTDIFWSRLEKERVVSKPYFAGMRVNVKPFPWVEFGVSRTIMFGGKGRPDIDWHEFLTILGGKNISGGKDSSNSVAAIDVSLRFPFLAGAQVYGEYGGEDEAGHFLAASAWTAGFYLPHVEPSGRLSLRLEYADLSKDDNMAPPWYRHGTYKSGYTYNGNIMGHHVGGAAEDLFIETEILLRHDLRLVLGLDFEKRGSDQSVQEKHLESTAQLNWQFNKLTRLNFLCCFDQVSHADFIKNNDQDHFLSRIGMSFSF